MGIFEAGVAGTFAMSLGTASVTVVVALAAVLFREGSMAGLGESRAVRLAIPALEVSAGVIVVAVAAQLLGRALA